MLMYVQCICFCRSGHLEGVIDTEKRCIPLQYLSKDTPLSAIKAISQVNLIINDSVSYFCMLESVTLLLSAIYAALITLVWV